jgi:hypothetical protein
VSSSRRPESDAPPLRHVDLVLSANPPRHDSPTDRREATVRNSHVSEVVFGAGRVSEDCSTATTGMQHGRHRLPDTTSVDPDFLSTADFVGLVAAVAATV